MKNRWLKFIKRQFSKASRRAWRDPHERGYRHHYSEASYRGR